MQMMSCHQAITTLERLGSPLTPALSPDGGEGAGVRTAAPAGRAPQGERIEVNHEPKRRGRKPKSLTADARAQQQLRPTGENVPKTFRGKIRAAIAACPSKTTSSMARIKTNLQEMFGEEFTDQKLYEAMSSMSSLGQIEHEGEGMDRRYYVVGTSPGTPAPSEKEKAYRALRAETASTEASED